MNPVIRRLIPVGFLILVLALACGISGGIYTWLKDDCAERGGHLELVWGNQAGWTCDGADRPIGGDS